MTTTPAVHFTAKDILADLRNRLGYARADLKQAELRGYSPEHAFTRVCVLAGLLGTYDPALQDDDTFIHRMTDVSDVPEYYTPEAE